MGLGASADDSSTDSTAGSHPSCPWLPRGLKQQKIFKEREHYQTNNVRKLHIVQFLKHLRKTREEHVLILLCLFDLWTMQLAI